MTDEQIKSLVQLITVVAAAGTAVVNMIAVFARGKVDPSALKVIDNMAKKSAANSRRQADRIDSLTASVAKELKEVNRSLGKVLAALDKAR